MAVVSLSKAVNPFGSFFFFLYSYLFFSDTGKETIERSAMDGSRRKVLLSGSYSLLDKPRGLAVSGQWLYFADGGGNRDEIGRVNFEGHYVAVSKPDDSWLPKWKTFCLLISIYQHLKGKTALQNQNFSYCRLSLEKIDFEGSR